MVNSQGLPRRTTASETTLFVFLMGFVHEGRMWTSDYIPWRFLENMEARHLVNG